MGLSPSPSGGRAVGLTLFYNVLCLTDTFTAGENESVHYACSFSLQLLLILPFFFFSTEIWGTKVAVGDGSKNHFPLKTLDFIC